MKRILIITDAWAPQVNGVVNTLRNTIAGLRAHGYVVEVVTPLEFRTLPCPTYPDIRLSLFPRRKIAQRIREFDPDNVHIVTEGPLGLAARRYCLKQDIPFTTAYHSRFPEYVKLRIGLPLNISYAWLRRFHNAARAVLVPTQKVYDDLNAAGFRHLQFWTRGVDTQLFCPGERARLEGDPPLFVYVGRVAVEKNIRAFLDLDLPGSKWVVGEGPQREALMRDYPDVHFAGVVPHQELPRIYRAADVFVFPSLTDTFGLVQVEAMACGTPVAAFPVTGPIDVLEQGVSGVMHEDLRTACLQALELDRERVAACGRQYGWDKPTRQFIAILEQHSIERKVRPVPQPA